MPSKPSSAERFEREHVRPRAGRTLLVGSFVAGGKADRRALYSDAVGVDMRPGPGVDRVLNLEAELPASLGTFAHVECISVLEHSRRPWLLASNLERLLEPGGTIFVSVPFVWRFHGYPNDYFRFTAEGVRELFQGVEWSSLMYGSDRLRPDHYLRAEDASGYPMMPRCEVLGFGARRS
jgi:SAM-dependent methyltransferase